MVEVFRELRRVLRDDGTLWLNIGDSYAGGGGITGVPDNWDSISTKNRGKYAADNPNRKSHAIGLKPKDLCMIPARVALALQADGWWLRSVIIWHKPSCMPESVTDRPTTSHEYVYLLTKNESYYYDADAIREPSESANPNSDSYREKGKSDSRIKDKIDGKPAFGDSGFWQPNPTGRNKRTVWTINPEPTPYAHFATFPQKLVEPCIMAGTSEKGNCGKCGKPWVRVVDKPFVGDNINKRKDGYVRPEGKDGLCRPPAGARYEGKTTGWQASCSCGVDPVPAIVIDIFSGSGTVGVVAKKLQRKYILIDLNAEYNKIAEDRLRQKELF